MTLYEAVFSCHTESNWNAVRQVHLILALQNVNALALGQLWIFDLAVRGYGTATKATYAPTIVPFLLLFFFSFF